MNPLKIIALLLIILFWVASLFLITELTPADSLPIVLISGAFLTCVLGIFTFTIYWDCKDAEKELREWQARRARNNELYLAEIDRVNAL